jgi:hypothetical protein
MRIIRAILSGCPAPTPRPLAQLPDARCAASPETIRDGHPTIQPGSQDVHPPPAEINRESSRKLSSRRIERLLRDRVSTTISRLNRGTLHARAGPRIAGKHPPKTAHRAVGRLLAL